jgi:hypothetical protein
MVRIHKNPQAPTLCTGLRRLTSRSMFPSVNMRGQAAGLPTPGTGLSCPRCRGFTCRARKRLLVRNVEKLSPCPMQCRAGKPQGMLLGREQEEIGKSECRFVMKRIGHETWPGRNRFLSETGKSRRPRPIGVPLRENLENLLRWESK